EVLEPDGQAIGERLDLDLELALVLLVAVQRDVVEGLAERRHHLAVEVVVRSAGAGDGVDAARVDELAGRGHGPNGEVAVFELAWEFHPDHAWKRPLGGIVSDFWVRFAAEMDWKVRIVKRAIDVASSAIGLALTAPLFPVLAAAIKLDSKGPVLYRQRRAGLLLGVERVNGAPHYAFTTFDVLKFRTMRTDAEKATGAVLAQQNDPRVTRIGKFLRRSRLDELPQLWCVLRGDMS